MTMEDEKIAVFYVLAEEREMAKTFTQASAEAIARQLRAQRHREVTIEERSELRSAQHPAHREGV
jgi:hypothetical protein